ncbi:hypothetical protein BDV59DRAFT_48214 [Aspergillus ambiguus]|uniref:sulfotransferase family protein n=1 Tax=Aspergillus ambiguus TaxID=176160 RepID=UPI003CCD66CC
MSTPQERHPELFWPINSEFFWGKKRTVPLECLCLGFNQTGTASMCNALETLVLPCWHSIQFMSTEFGDIEMWQEVVDLVLVERDIDSWYESWMNSVIKNTYDPFVTIIYTIDRWFTHPLEHVRKSTFRGWLGIQNPEDVKRVSKEKYREHNALVRRLTAPDRLLEFKMADGWAPLCEFLGKPVSDMPFPHLNEKVEIVLERGMKRLASKVVLYFLAPLVAAWLIYRVP